MVSTPSRRARLVSWWWDYVVLLAWLGLVFVVVGVPQLLGLLDLEAVWTCTLAADAVITVLTVVPLLAYLTLSESGPWRATWGKRRAGIAVLSPSGGPAFGRVVVRNVVKVLPWQLGHMAAMRLATQEPSPVALVLYAGSLVLLAVVVLPVLVGRTGLHDRLAGTRIRTSPRPGA